MLTETLTQNFKSINEGPGIEFVCSMIDQNGRGQEVGVNEEAGTIAFNGWGPSIGTMSNVVLTGGNPPNKMTFNVSGKGNLSGNGNDDSYSGSGSWQLSWAYNEITHQYQVHAVNGSISVTYTD